MLVYCRVAQWSSHPNQHFKAPSDHQVQLRHVGSRREHHWQRSIPGAWGQGDVGPRAIKPGQGKLDQCDLFKDKNPTFGWFSRLLGLGFLFRRIILENLRDPSKTS